ncbi:MAG: hypothetical protein ACI8PT_004343 [Gammaproteobacteria bacterium]
MTYDARAYADASGICGNLTMDLPEYCDGTGRTGRICDTRRIIKVGEEV